MKHLTILALALILTGCGLTGPKVTKVCQEADWYELGRRDGANGLPFNTYEERKKLCKESNTAENLDLYSNGRNAGLLEFCSPTSGLELGKVGYVYKFVCPPQLEKGFLKEYKVGRNIYELKQKAKTLTEKITSLQFELKKKGVSLIRKQELTSQLNELKEKEQENQKVLSQLDQQP